MRFDQSNDAVSLRARLAAVFAIAVLTLGLAAVSAQACSYPGAKQVFAPWGDQHSYALAPDGGFESGGAGWSLRGAQVVAGNETYQLNGPTDSQSLALPTGSSATSPPICMSIDTPLFRFMARNTGDPSSRLRVEAVYSLLGLVRTNVVNTVSGVGSAWGPSKPMSTVLGLSTIVGTILPSAIEVRFTPLDSIGRWQVDDVYVDPFARH